jgi:pimeloyl-ACP methyl ester carboxylesterase
MRFGAALVLLFAGVATASAQPGAAGLPPPAAASRDVTVLGQKIHYLETGSGPAVVLLHGLADDATIWSATIAALAPRFHVYAIDQIGFGQSAKPLIPYRVATFTDFLDGFYQAVGLSRATLVGNSLGGWVAADFALAHPDKVDRLVHVDAAGVFTGIPLTREWASTLNPSSLAGMKKVMALVFYDKRFLADDVVARSWADQIGHGDGYTISQALESMLRREDFLEGRLGAIKAPTLVVWGREDALLPLAIGEQFAHDIPGARTAWLDRCGHLPQLECPDALDAAIAAFLNGR